MARWILEVPDGEVDQAVEHINRLPHLLGEPQTEPLRPGGRRDAVSSKPVGPAEEDRRDLEARVERLERLARLVLEVVPTGWLLSELGDRTHGGDREETRT